MPMTDDPTEVAVFLWRASKERRHLASTSRETAGLRHDLGRVFRCRCKTGTDGVIERHAVEPRRHRELLVPFIERVVERARKRRCDTLDAVILGNGPGSFIGLRIAASGGAGTSRLLADIQIVPDVVARRACRRSVMAAEEESRVLVAQDARMEQVYLSPSFREDTAPAS